MHKRLLVGLLLAAAWPAASSGQTISWEIKKHSTNMTRFEAEVSGYVKRGCVPVGLTYDKREIYVMYLQGIEVEVSAWRMAWYDTVDGIREGINGKIAEGFIPSAITYTGDSFFVLFIKTPGQVLAWQIVPSSADLEDVGRKLKPYAGDKYMPTGISFYGGQYWTLLLKMKNSSIKKYLVESYKTGTHGPAIDANIRRGYLPWGVEYSGKDRIDILYVGF